MNYLLENKKPVACEDIIEWARSFEKLNRRVAKDKIGDISVSTVFLGIDHGWNGKVELFETMIFGGEHDEECWRYATWGDAEAGHAAAVKLVNGP